MEVIPPSLVEAWNTWNIHGFILLSLTLQTILTFLAPFRKTTSNTLLVVLIWSAYSGADWTSNFVLGLISKSMGQEANSISEKKRELLAFWTSFLLLHLGGPDTITAFTLEDNELWIRYLMSFVLQAIASAYITLQSIPSLYSSNLWLPTFFVFVAGSIKCVERVRAQYLSSSEVFRDSMLSKPDTARVEARLDTTEGALSDLQVLQYAHSFLVTFKRKFVDFMVDKKEAHNIGQFFRNRTSEDTFLVIEAELNFVYEILYTKVSALRCKLGYLLRMVSFILILAACLLFYLMHKKGYNSVDLGISYALLFGTMALETTAVILHSLSDWTTASLMDLNNGSLIMRTVRKVLLHIIELVVIKRRRLLGSRVMESPTRFLCRRWNESVPQYNLINYCLHQFRQQKSNTFFGKMKRVSLLNILKEKKYVSSMPFSKLLRDFIYLELRLKAEYVYRGRKKSDIASARGEWTLERGWGHLRPWIENFQYVDSILVWHMATEILYVFTNDVDHGIDKLPRDLAKLLSDYMLYLCVMRPNFIPEWSSASRIRLEETCAEVKTFFGDMEKEEACKKLIFEKFEKGDEYNKSVLFDAAELVKSLASYLYMDHTWGAISRVWAEMLSYAAIRCSGHTHAQQLSKGGELITLVWLLESHL